MRSSPLHRPVPSLLLLCCLSGGAAAQGLPPIETTFANGSSLRLYGQINKGVLSYDDGAKTESYGLVDNDNASTRAGLRFNQDFGDGWNFGTRIELGYAPYSTADVNIENQSNGDWGFDNDNIRWIDFSFANDAYGRFSLGQGAMSTDGIEEIDLSGTDVVAYGSVADSANAQILRYSNKGANGALAGELSPIEIGDAFTNYDGPRRVRIRYDSQDFNGFALGASYGRNLLSDNSDTREENLFDVALRYENTFADAFEVEAGVGYFDRENDGAVFGGSISGLHTPSGLNLTFALSQSDPDEGEKGRYFYGKVGIVRDVVSWGATAVSIDYYEGDDFFTDDNVTSSTSESIGIGFVQSLDFANTDLWLTYRTYDYSDNFADYEDSSVLFGGAIFRF